VRAPYSIASTKTTTATKSTSLRTARRYRWTWSRTNDPDPPVLGGEADPSGVLARKGIPSRGSLFMLAPRVSWSEATLQGSWREGGSPPGDPPSCANKFSEPGALSSTAPTNFRLPPTAYRSGIDLLASRARCKGESTGRRGAGSRGRKSLRPQIATFSF
jgi:hypothetical protein